MGPKRPWFLVAALLFAWVFGAAGFINGCSDAMELHQGHIDVAEQVPETGFGSGGDPQTRAARIAMLQELNDARVDMSSRLYPLAVATFLLGGTLVLFAARAMAGRGSARWPVIQFTIAQAILSLIAFWMTKHLRDIQLGQMLTAVRESGNDQEAIDLTMRYWPRIFHVGAIGVLIARNVIALLIVVALTRVRTKEFFAAMDRRFSQL